MEFLVVFVLISTLTNAYGQLIYNEQLNKPGSCPPLLPIQLCSQSCRDDSNCFDNEKCCSTSCGGTVCTVPVTAIKPRITEKPGSCPSKPSGRWICSSTCSIDADCHGTRKCCRNRCGGLSCQKPDVEIIPSVEIPVTLQPEIINNNIGNVETPHPYSNNPFLSNTNNNIHTNE